MTVRQESLPTPPISIDISRIQHTLVAPVRCAGVALHSGKMVEMLIKPAPENTGIIFERLDIEADKNLVRASYDNVVETTLGTTIANAQGTEISTIEHLMAALWGYGIDNAVIALEGSEIPIMDGSSEPFYFLLECTGRVPQSATRHMLQLLKPVRVTQGNSTAIAEPSDGFSLDISIEYDHPLLRLQRDIYDFSEGNFKQMLSRARTFGFMRDVEKMHEMGLARGGSLNNAIVLSDEGILNEGGLRYYDECLRHKALDCVGDFFLAGAGLQAAITSFKPGHGINNALLRAIFADKSNYRMHGGEVAIAPIAVDAVASSATLYAA
jgi:UDP-3-O-[3-hydroxymyristoyl] N-acetylglucosamine deacetylase